MDGRTATIAHAGPLEFDRDGFPVAQDSPQRSPDFIARVYRLLKSSAAPFQQLHG